MPLTMPLEPTRNEARHAMVLLILGCAALALSSIAPRNRLTWFMEVLPVFIAGPLLMLTWQRFRLTLLSYQLIFIHAIILIVGAHYTYALVPAGEWVQHVLNLDRNPYDRLGHFAQGFVPAILAREILLRLTPLRRGRMLFFLVCCICLAISAFYELLEWGAALAMGEKADAFLGTQGDVWDTQWDMFVALVGAVLAQALLARRHDRQISRLNL
ncbi:MAG TPA: DUF2238 domain-containing protein [Burkholderiales bacterium]|jgi:Predicted membrane protein